MKDIKVFYAHCMRFCEDRQLCDDSETSRFPDNYDWKARDGYYKSYYHSWAGSNGCDSIIIALDALLSTLNFVE